MHPAGITGYAAYLPRRRLSREAAAEAQHWLAPNLAGEAKGYRTLAGWDEDAITMAVEAARNALGPGDDRSFIRALHFASTTPVYLDRLNAAIVAAALTLDETIHGFDATGARRAGTGAILQALDGAAFREGSGLVVVADKRKARAASAQELAYGDAGAAVVVGRHNVVARFLGSACLTVDFADRFRAPDAEYDYLWEERWAREEGFAQFVPRIIGEVLARARVQAGDVARLLIPCPFRGLAREIAAKAGFRAEALADDLRMTCGDLGAATGPVMLAAALETAKPGDKILLADFGQGAEALLFEATPAITNYRPARTFAEQVAGGAIETNYLRYLTTRGMVDWEKGPRAEKDARTSVSALFRNRSAVSGLVGARNPATGEVQFPPSRMALGEVGDEVDILEPYKLAERPARIVSWSADRMAMSPDPPNYYGMIEFGGGGRLMADITDVLDQEIKTGTSMRMVFRIKEIDAARHYTRYFWKATPSTLES